MKTFLFLANFSATSYHAYYYLLEIIQIIKGRIVIYHALNETFPPDAAKFRMEEIQKIAQDKGIQAEYFINSGELSTGIEEPMQIFQPDIIFMGIKASFGLEGVLKDSSILQIIKKYKKMTWIIPDNITFKPIKKILFAYDRKPFKNELNDSLHFLKELATANQAEVRIAIVKPKNINSTVEEKHELTKLEHFFSTDIKHSVKRIYDDTMIGGLNYYIKLKNDNNLLVMIDREYNLWEKSKEQSQVNKNKIEFYTHIPLLVLSDG